MGMRSAVKAVASMRRMSMGCVLSLKKQAESKTHVRDNVDVVGIEGETRRGLCVGSRGER
jgi:hypothetical protein